jgi:hypothetical protein
MVQLWYHAIPGLLSGEIGTVSERWNATDCDDVTFSHVLFDTRGRTTSHCSPPRPTVWAKRHSRQLAKRRWNWSYQATWRSRWVGSMKRESDIVLEQHSNAKVLATLNTNVMVCNTYDNITVGPDCTSLRLRRSICTETLLAYPCLILRELRRKALQTRMMYVI